ncbi:AP-1 complex subunit beta-1-like [Sycon ciliatum]|uniref:AP-1 complex subunit beta-1-like n=1 Tax=Sycon ciliatum TaxID=27933 RepID=UPI0020A9A153|eukprot:scpid27243/ scgid8382/ AP-1 complex subunit beta-1; Adapter-related protein complex 1 subunit beta-1; Adaptor protein complex AP-1 subunit beta-1; Beta-1-adaptin; Beta-adaptin 1; Clathrin assembly protein complex 1 beta large chain; Golgi adaptor HA1/AP1 adaptin beta subunit
MTDSKYFTTTKKGEIAELKADLAGDKKEKKRDAVKKIIANMTVGKDVSTLFPDVVNCMQTSDVELKKLVYLYLMNYAKSHPDMAIMAVNTFARDCEDHNPLVRALAVRTMGCIRVDKITEYLCDPLRKCLKDDDPYVRKTAAVCVVKMHDINASLVEDQGFLDLLKDLVSDANPMVVANAVASLTEICDNSPSARSQFELNPALVNKLLTSLNECAEWGQVFILDSLALYVPKEEREAKSICERVTPRLNHSNSAVVLSAVRVIMRLMELLEQNADYHKSLLAKLAPPLVTLLSSEPEIQYVALRNISLIVQKRPDILTSEIKVFFVKYNDPIYVKLEKLDIMIRLCNKGNIQSVLPELKEYAAEVDVDFVRKSVRAIGRCAIKVESEAERAVQTLLDLIQTKVNYVVQEAVVVIKDIFRKYPNKYESIISTLCENLHSLDEPDARASMIWILGEYAERIDNASELLESFVEHFADEPTHVQLQLLTAVVKLFLKQPNDTQTLVQSVLSLATQESDNPDLRDRGYIYWRLLSTDPGAAKTVVLADKPHISEETDLLEPALLEELICHIASLSSVYHKPPATFTERKTPHRSVTLPQKAEPTPGSSTAEPAAPAAAAPAAAPAAAGIPAATVIPTPSIPGQDNLIGDLLSLDSRPPPAQQAGSGDILSELSALGLADPSLSVAPQAPGTAGGGAGFPVANGTGAGAGDLFSLQSVGMFQSGTSYTAPKSVWLEAAQGKGCMVEGTFSRRQSQIYADLTINNRAMQAMTAFAVQFNKNSFGLTPGTPLQIPHPIAANQSIQTSLAINTNGPVQRVDPLTLLQVAMKNNIDVFYFSCQVPYWVLWDENGQMERKVFLATWKDIPNTNEVQSMLSDISLTPDAAEGKLKNNNVFTIARRTVEIQELLYVSLKFTNGIWVLGELKFTPGGTSVALALKTRATDVVAGVQQSLDTILRNA